MSTPRTIILATHNRHKRDELIAVLTAELGPGWMILTLDDVTPPIGEIEETGTTLEENALIKARAVHQATGLAALADDTGLEVEALGGAPGVYTARYAGPDATYADNVNKLLRELAGTKGPRRATFSTVIAFVSSDEAAQTFRGEVLGVITGEARGTNGFGYDPVFAPVEDAAERTFAEMSDTEKHALSHRGRALRAFAAAFRD